MCCWNHAGHDVVIVVILLFLFVVVLFLFFLFICLGMRVNWRTSGMYCRRIDSQDWNASC